MLLSEVSWHRLSLHTNTHTNVQWKESRWDLFMEPTAIRHEPTTQTNSKLCFHWTGVVWDLHLWGHPGHNRTCCDLELTASGHVVARLWSISQCYSPLGLLFVEKKDHTPTRVISGWKTNKTVLKHTLMMMQYVMFCWKMLLEVCF